MALKQIESVSDYWDVLMHKTTETDIYDVACPDFDYFEAVREAACFKILLDSIENINRLDTEFKKIILDGTKMLRGQSGLDAYHLIHLSSPESAAVYMELRDKATAIRKHKKADTSA